MKAIKGVFILLFLVNISLNAQGLQRKINSKIDSFALHVDDNPSLSLRYITDAYILSRSSKNDSLTARCLCNMGYYYYTQYNIPEAKRRSLEAITMSKKTSYFKVLSSSYDQMGQISFDSGKYDESLQWYLSALKITDSVIIPNIRSRILTNLGYLYLTQKDTVRSLGYYQKSVINAEKYGLLKELAVGYETVGVLYSESEPLKSEASFRKALSIARKNKFFYTEFSLYIDLSNLYLKSANDRSADKAYEVLQKAVTIEKTLKDDSLLFYVNFNLGAYYLYKKEYDAALNFYTISLVLSEKHITSDQKLKLYSALSEIYIYKNDFKNALVFKDRYNGLKDSIFDIEKNRSFNEIQTRYGVDKKNLKIKLLTKDHEIQKNRNWNIVFTSLTLLAILTVALFFMRHRIKLQRIISLKQHKIHRQEIIRLEQEQELKRVKGVLEGQNTERNRLAKEIHDGIGGSLAGIKLQLSQANADLKDEKITVIVKQIGAAFTELRSISHNLSDNFLDNRNLNTKLLQLKDDYENRKEFKMEICIFPENSLEVLSDLIKHNIFRIVQELITNVSRHANAEQVLLNFTKRGKLLNIIVEDDGIGFQGGHTEGIGFKNIKERISSLNSTIVIESVLGKGTTILIDIPTNEN